MIDPKNYRPMTCPVCGKFEFTELQEADLLIRDYMQCFSCGWKYDHNQINHPDLAEGLNTLSLSDYKAWYQEQIKTDPEYNWLERTINQRRTVVPSANRPNLKTKAALKCVRTAGGVMMASWSESPTSGKVAPTTCALMTIKRDTSACAKQFLTTTLVNTGRATNSRPRRAEPARRV